MANNYFSAVSMKAVLSQVGFVGVFLSLVAGIIFTWKWE